MWVGGVNHKRYQVQIYKTLSFNKSTALAAADIDSLTGQIFLLDENFLRFFFKAAIAVRPVYRIHIDIEKKEGIELQQLN